MPGIHDIVSIQNSSLYNDYNKSEMEYAVTQVAPQFVHLKVAFSIDGSLGFFITNKEDIINVLHCLRFHMIDVLPYELYNNSKYLNHELCVQIRTTLFHDYEPALKLTLFAEQTQLYNSSIIGAIVIGDYDLFRYYVDKKTGLKNILKGIMNKLNKPPKLPRDQSLTHDATQDVIQNVTIIGRGVFMAGGNVKIFKDFFDLRLFHVDQSDIELMIKYNNVDILRFAMENSEVLRNSTGKLSQYSKKFYTNTIIPNASAECLKIIHEFVDIDLSTQVSDAIYKTLDADNFDCFKILMEDISKKLKLEINYRMFYYHNGYYSVFPRKLIKTKFDWFKYYCNKMKSDGYILRISIDSRIYYNLIDENKLEEIKFIFDSGITFEPGLIKVAHDKKKPEIVQYLKEKINELY